MRISDVKVMLLTYVVPKQHQTPSEFGTRVSFHAAIVRVETDEGIVGYGEAGGTPMVMKAIVEKQLKPIWVGQDPTQVERLWELMYNGARLGLALKYGRSHPVLGRRGETVCAISGVDVALWDVYAKSLGLPIYKLLGGGCRERIRAYASGGWAPLGMVAEEIGGYMAKGFTAVKMRVGGIDEPRPVSGSLARVREARQSIGAKADLMVDAHGSFGVKSAIQFAQAAEEHNLYWFEEPVCGDNLAGLAEVRAATSIPIAAGENEFTRFGFRDYIENSALDVFQPDVAIVGGLTECRRIADIASAWHIALAPHVWGSAVLFATSLQLAAAIPNCVIFEFCQANNNLLYDMMVDPIQVDRDGYVTIPQKPGLGMELQPDLEKKYPFQENVETVRPLTA